MKPSQINASEFSPFFKQYIALVDDINLLEALANGLVNTTSFFESIPKEKLLYRYADGKWTPKEILLHLIDTESIMCYRALYFARNEGANLEGFDENVFAKNSNANDRSIEDLLKHYFAIRTVTIYLFKSFSEAALIKTGMANRNLISVRSLGFIICGHEIHHCNIITERYLS
jgi:hypothetical protein